MPDESLKQEDYIVLTLETVIPWHEYPGIEARLCYEGCQKGGRILGVTKRDATAAEFEYVQLRAPNPREGA